MKQDNIGYIHSIETMGLLDGPGIRFVVFMQGCNLRCLYCHNPDSWCKNIGTKITPIELVSRIEKYKSYFGDTGGVTFSGGEPLVQSSFLLECLKLCKEKSINTCLDTSGVGGTKNAEILKYTDLVMWDIKAVEASAYKSLVSKDIDESLEFLNLCMKLYKKMWLRQVIIPGINDTNEYISKLVAFIKPLSNIEKIEFLPYELLGVHKYKQLHLKYRLEGTLAMDKVRCNELYNQLIQGLQK